MLGPLELGSGLVGNENSMSECQDSMAKHSKLNECVRQASLDYDDSMLAGENSVIYKYGDGVIEGNQLKLSKNNIKIPGQKHSISLNIPNPYSDMID